ncbi:hypothetical protein CLAFUW4_00299 [Fulvia fulva]|nr:hypothetical protein CLAFUR4_00299 [Fulvia fulva]KAK4637486.1 hypothetical protein CLAFUR0_00300 [Fulvia fulva]WPV10053.1 hypothetical protein CLAFUW4_00299 [Fulvia fulva]WPV25326.1 hypothetical protein CLAFUW7_00303 [Fulvia fulva]
MKTGNGGVLAAAVLSGLFLLIVLVLLVFVLRKYIRRSVHRQRGYQTLSDTSRSSQHQYDGSVLVEAHAQHHRQIRTTTELNLAAADLVVDTKAAHPAALDSRYSCDGANAYPVIPAQAKQHGEGATKPGSLRPIDNGSADQDTRRKSRTKQPKASSPPRSIRQGAMIRAAIAASTHDERTSNSYAKKEPNGLTPWERLADARAATTNSFADTTGHLSGSTTTDAIDASPQILHGKFLFEREHDIASSLTKTTTLQQQGLPAAGLDCERHGRRDMSRSDLPSERTLLARRSTMLAQQYADLGLSVPTEITFDVC